MNGKDAHTTSVRTNWKTWVSIVSGTAALVVVFVIARWMAAPEVASAQAPIVQARQPNGQGPSPATTPRTKAPASPAVKQTGDIVAVVNSTPITRQQLGRECLRRFGSEIIESLINRQLIAQACQQQGITISDADVEREITGLANKFGLPPAQFVQMLEKKRNITSDEYRRDIIWPTLALRKLAATQIQVTRAEIDRAVEAKYGAQVRVRLISVTNRDKADQVHALAVSGQHEFAQLARQHSEDASSASVGGIIPPIRRYVGEDVVWQTAFGLRKGQVSQVIPVANQFLILHCEDFVAATPIPGSQRSAIHARLEEEIRDHKLRGAAKKCSLASRPRRKWSTFTTTHPCKTSIPGSLHLSTTNRCT